MASTGSVPVVMKWVKPRLLLIPHSLASVSHVFRWMTALQRITALRNPRWLNVGHQEA